MHQQWLTLACLALLACSTVGEVVSPDSLMRKHQMSGSYDNTQISNDQLKLGGARRLHQEFDINKALVAAAYQGDVSLVQRILAAGANPNAIIQLESARVTALIAAVLKDDGAMVRVLIQGGASPDLSVDGTYALGFAVFQGKFNAARALIAGGADPNRFMFGAAIANRPEALEVLIDGGGDPNLVDEGFTVLSMAAFGGAEDSVRVLVNRGANISARTGGGATAFDAVCLCTRASPVPEGCLVQICNSGGRERMQSLLS